MSEGHDTAVTVEDIRRRLQAHRAELEAEGVRTLAVFGSTARGEADADSDIDLLVELDPAARMGLFRFSDLRLTLCDLLGRQVDLITRRGLPRDLRERVDAGAHPIF